MICKQCNKNIPEDSNLCPYCGAPCKDNEQREPGGYYEQADSNKAYDYGYYQSNRDSGTAPKNSRSEDVSLIKVLGFFLGLLFPAFWFLPIISLVLFFVWRTSRPEASTAIGKFTLIGMLTGFIASIVFSIIIAVVLFFLAAGPLFNIAKGLLEHFTQLIPFDFLKNFLENIFNNIQNFDVASLI